VARPRPTLVIGLMKRHSDEASAGSGGPNCHHNELEYAIARHNQF
jgi:hypothetical protein